MKACRECGKKGIYTMQPGPTRKPPWSPSPTIIERCKYCHATYIRSYKPDVEALMKSTKDKQFTGTETTVTIKPRQETPVVTKEIRNGRETKPPRN